MSFSPTATGVNEDSTFSWSTTDATSFSTDVYGALDLSGSIPGAHSGQTITVNGTVTGPGGTNSCSATLTVNQPPAPPPPSATPTCTMSFSPSTVGVNENSTLTWSTSNATSFSTDIYGSLALSGSIPGAHSGQTITVNGTVQGASGTATCSATLTVNQPPPATNHPAGGYFDTATCTSLDGWVVDPDDPNDPANVRIFEDGPSASGTLLGTFLTSVFRGDVTESTTGIPGLVAGNHGFSVPTPASAKDGATHTFYAYAVDNQTGDLSQLNKSPLSVTCPAPPPNAPTCTLSASPSSINPGGSSTLTWTTTNAASVAIDNGVGAVAANSSKQVSPTSNTTYTLTATSASGATATCTAPVTITSSPPAAPTCTLTATPSSVASGGTTELAWTTTNAASFSIDNGIGAVTPLAGGATTSPAITATTTFIGTVTSASGATATC
ncbi:MAG: hypothetical protein KGI03_00275, partial [Patescibacteria group bacterium]|nr:hypothetical protein [Patescibacteria group bacterium]